MSEMDPLGELANLLGLSIFDGPKKTIKKEGAKNDSTREDEDDGTRGDNPNRGVTINNIFKDVGPGRRTVKPANAQEKGKTVREPKQTEGDDSDADGAGESDKSDD